MQTVWENEMMASKTQHKACEQITISEIKRDN